MLAYSDSFTTTLVADSFNSLRGGSLAERSRGSISMGSLGGHSLTEALNNAGLMEEDGEWGE